MAALSRTLGLSHIVSATGRSNGRPAERTGSPWSDRPAAQATAKGEVAAGGATTTTIPPSPKRPTGADPLRVLIVGDSLGIDLGSPSSTTSPPPVW